MGSLRGVGAREDEASAGAANRAFYEAFEARDIDAMSDVWEHSDRVACTHPGWVGLRGWARVAGSFVALFQNAQRLQFILTEERVNVVGDVAWVTADENIIDASEPLALAVGPGSTVVAVNLFVRDTAPGAWRLVLHHASVVSAGSAAEE